MDILIMEDIITEVILIMDVAAGGKITTAVQATALEWEQAQVQERQAVEI